MESFLETIDVDIEEPAELLFKVKVEGMDPSPARVRLVCESSDVSFMFNGKLAGHDDLIAFNLPQMSGRLKEGKLLSRVEVLIENRYFAPVQFELNFKKAVKVVAEAVTRVKQRSPEVIVTAVPVTQHKQASVSEVKQEARERVAPPPAKEAARLTLRERFQSKALSMKKERLDEEAILVAAKDFVLSHRKR